MEPAGRAQRSCSARCGPHRAHSHVVLNEGLTWMSICRNRPGPRVLEGVRVSGGTIRTSPARATSSSPADVERRLALRDDQDLLVGMRVRAWPAARRASTKMMQTPTPPWSAPTSSLAMLLNGRSACLRSWTSIRSSYQTPAGPPTPGRATAGRPSGARAPWARIRSIVSTVTFGFGPTASCAARAQLLERVGRVAGEQDVVAVVVDADHRDVARRVAGRRHGDDAAVLGQRPARGEGARTGRRRARAARSARPRGAAGAARCWKKRDVARARTRAPRRGPAPAAARCTAPSMWSPCMWVSTTVSMSRRSGRRRPARPAAPRSGSTPNRANGTSLAAAISPVSTRIRRPSCSTTQRWIGSGSENGPGMNRRSCRSGPSLAYRNACLTLTVPVVSAWILIPQLSLTRPS